MKGIVGPDWQILFDQDTMTFMFNGRVDKYCFMQMHALYLQNSLSDDCKMGLEVSNLIDKMVDMGVLGRV